mmetsp:Transcript_3104/g.4789  ORF Transcript_3104/g.4789 Transcript_3104/m.4789 type:complete len:118 (+) Transcript_3104:459-812(+)
MDQSTSRYGGMMQPSIQAGQPVAPPNPYQQVPLHSAPSAPAPPSNLGTSDSRVVCPYCNTEIFTVTRQEPGTVTWLLCLFVCLLFNPCWFVPFLIPQCMNTVHSCPQCHQVISETKV